MAYFCYMVRCTNDAYYTGWTTDPIRRVKEHNAGRGARYTKMHGPVELVYIEEVEDHSAALKREAQIKRYTHGKKAAMADESGLPLELCQEE
ncbi:MAG: GIY-YIG nuclease family protein [Brevefilum sp.]|nr:GIY-YIG nuclease family protein [Brevefilum sp.]